MTRQRFAVGKWGRQGCLSVVWATMGLTMGVFSAGAAQGAADGAAKPDLKRAFAGVDARRVAQPMASDAEFQKAVREMFGVLTEEGKRKVMESITSIKEGRGPLVTGTPVDGLVRKRLAMALTRFVVDEAAKEALAEIEDDGTLEDLLAVLTMPKTPPVPVAAAALSAETAKPAGKKSEPSAGPKDDEAFELRWVAGKTWTSESGTKWTFARDGSGEKVHGTVKTALTWRELPGEGMIEVGGRDAADAPLRVWFIQFKSKSEAIYGSSKTEMPVKMSNK